ncbi:hypothetical protein TNCV_4201921 [Trichonephila clavipes]|nr:hypothetical protein TNCV_4201921 [Trichonephila clavipes]
MMKPNPPVLQVTGDFGLVATPRLNMMLSRHFPVTFSQNNSRKVEFYHSENEKQQLLRNHDFGTHVPFLDFDVMDFDL